MHVNISYLSECCFPSFCLLTLTVVQGDEKHKLCSNSCTFVPIGSEMAQYD